MAADPDVPVDPVVITNTEPIDLPIGSFVNDQDLVCLPDGTIIGTLIEGGRDLIANYLEAVAPLADVPPPGAPPA